MTNLIKVAFPKINKTCDLKETDKEIAAGHYVQNCKVMQKVEVGDAVYNRLGMEFMDNVNEAIWGYIGGSASDDSRLDSVEHPNEIFNNTELRDIFMETCYTMVTEVINKDSGDRFYVNTEGLWLHPICRSSRLRTAT